MYDRTLRLVFLVISKNTDERFLFRFKSFILEIEDIEKNEERMSCKELAHIRHWLLQSAESIQGLEVMISEAHALVHSAFCYETRAYLIIIRLPSQLPSIEAAFKVIYLKYSNQRPSLLAYTLNWDCSKMLNYGLNHGFKFFVWKYILYSIESSGYRTAPL